MFPDFFLKVSSKFSQVDLLLQTWWIVPSITFLFYSKRAQLLKVGIVPVALGFWYKPHVYDPQFIFQTIKNFQQFESSSKFLWYFWGILDFFAKLLRKRVYWVQLDVIQNLWKFRIGFRISAVFVIWFQQFLSTTKLILFIWKSVKVFLR